MKSPRPEKELKNIINKSNEEQENHKGDWFAEGT